MVNSAANAITSDDHTTLAIVSAKDTYTGLRGIQMLTSLSSGRTSKFHESLVSVCKSRNPL
jgi:hypothetical protein